MSNFKRGGGTFLKDTYCYKRSFLESETRFSLKRNELIFTRQFLGRFLQTCEQVFIDECPELPRMK